MSKPTFNKLSRKIRKQLLWIYPGIILGLVYLLCFIENHTPEQTTSLPSEQIQPGEAFILTWMINPNGTLKTNLQSRETSNEGVAVGTDSLSESLGLWMLYAIEKQDLNHFQQAYSLLNQHYLSNKGTVLWKISYHSQDDVYTNALVDDLRIIEALDKANKIWGNKKYTDTAKTISKSIQKYQIVNHSFSSFYNTKTNENSDTIPLSYLDPTAIETMYELETINHNLYQSTKQFLKNIPNPDIFYPKSFNIQAETYHYDEVINLIDQIYIAYHQAKMGYVNSDFYTFIKEEFAKHGVLFGRYQRSSKSPAVRYESPALYGLTILYAIEIDDFKFAKQLYYKMIQHQTLHPDAPYYGGIIDYSKNDTHIFDNLLPLLAERKMFNEGILQ